MDMSQPTSSTRAAVWGDRAGVSEDSSAAASSVASRPTQPVTMVANISAAGTNQGDSAEGGSSHPTSAVAVPSSSFQTAREAPESVTPHAEQQRESDRNPGQSLSPLPEQTATPAPPPPGPGPASPLTTDVQRGNASNTHSSASARNGTTPQSTVFVRSQLDSNGSTRTLVPGREDGNFQDSAEGNAADHIAPDFSVQKQTDYLRERDSQLAQGSAYPNMIRAQGLQGGVAAAAAATAYPEALPGLPMEVILQQQGLSPPSAEPTQQQQPQQPQQTTPGEGATPSQDWSTGLFECQRDIPACVDTVLCPYCTSSAQFNRLYRDQRGIYWPLCCGLCCIDCCWASSCYFVMANQLHTIIVRRSLRQRYNIWGAPGVASPTGNDGDESNRENNNAAGSTTSRTGGTGGVLMTLLDIGAGLFCTWCAMSQHHRELVAQGEWTGPIVFSQRETVLNVTPTVTLTS